MSKKIYKYKLKKKINYKKLYQIKNHSDSKFLTAEILENLIDIAKPTQQELKDFETIN